MTIAQATASDAGAGVGAIVLILAASVVGLAFYLLPTIVAVVRSHDSMAAIGVVNLFFGWTLLGWVGCLAWALTEPHRQQVVVVNQPGYPQHPQPAPAGVPPGWYADPYGSGRFRYWNGQQWTVDLG